MTAMIKEIIRSKRKTLALQIMPDASLIVRAPHRISLRAVHGFVREKLPWIREKQRIVRENDRSPSKKKFVAGEEFLYLGQRCKFVPREGPPLHLPHARDRLVAWYRGRALEVIGPRVKQLADQAGLRCARVGITGARHRWGSCSLKGSLNFSWRLVMAPLWVIDYVVAHELAHLEQANHSRAFWEKVEGLYPRYRQARKWLRKNQVLMEI